MARRSVQRLLKIYMPKRIEIPEVEFSDSEELIIPSICGATLSHTVLIMLAPIDSQTLI